jgi:hypothetical protein
MPYMSLNNILLMTIFAFKVGVVIQEVNTLESIHKLTN